jgi:hypothetical protein
VSPRFGHGVVEGFYGRPWTFDERASLIALLGKIGLSTFVVAPKNDPHGFGRPRRADADFENIGRLARLADRAGVRLFVSACVENAPSLAGAGVHGLVISMDDTWTTFAPALATEARGRAHGALALKARAAARAIASQTEVLLVPAI